MSFVKVAEFQRRGVIHFHALIRLDGPGDHYEPPQIGTDAAGLTQAIRQAAAHVQLTVEMPEGSGLVLRFGDQLDTQTVNGGPTGELAPEHAARYIAKYATKSAEDFSLGDRRISPETLPLLDVSNHVDRLVRRAWQLGEHDTYDGLRRWVHMLGFRGRRRWTGGGRLGWTRYSTGTVQRIDEQGEAPLHGERHPQNGVTPAWIAGTSDRAPTRTSQWTFQLAYQAGSINSCHPCVRSGQTSKDPGAVCWTGQTVINLCPAGANARGRLLSICGTHTFCPSGSRWPQRRRREPPASNRDSTAPAACRGLISEHRPGHPASANQRTISATCKNQAGDVEPCNLGVTKLAGNIVLNPHVTGSCVIILDEAAVTALVDLLGQDIGQDGPARNNRRTIPSTCTTHRSGIGFCNLRVTRVNGGIELDPHVTGACVIVFDAPATAALFDLLGQWLG